MIASMKTAMGLLTVNAQVTFQKQPVYFGEDVKGVLTVVVSKPATIGTIEVELLGEGHSECTISAGENSYRDVQNHNYLKSLLTIVDARPTGGFSVTDTMSFDFEFKLPYGSFPSSDESRPKREINMASVIVGHHQASPFVNTVKYSCKFIVKDLNNAVIHTEAFPLRTRAHHNYVGGEVPSQADFYFFVNECACLCVSGQNANIHIATDKTVYFPGEYIQARVWVDNASSSFFVINKTVRVAFQRQTNVASKGNLIVAKRHGPNEISYCDRQSIVETSVSLSMTGEHSQMTFLVPEDIVPTFDYVMGCNSFWLYTINVAIPRGNFSLVVVINSKAPSGLLMYPPVALPAPTNRDNQYSAVKSGAFHNAGMNTSAFPAAFPAAYPAAYPASYAAPGQVNLEMVVPTFAPAGTAAYQPVMTEEIKR